MRAVARLIDRGFESYLVGGCVRDLLLDRTPKDYDIATEARPPQVKRTFPRNCRIIGRRFKLAHLHFHHNTKILECSTFRRTPQENENGGDDDDLLITRDNEFGTAEEDALRRDFTVNALFLDPTEDRIVDHVNGLQDIEQRVIRTIGDPVVRFREDPVRILRAVKFAGRLGFTIEKRTFAAMEATAEDLVRAAPPRVLEEILRLLRSGHAHDSFRLLQDIDALRYLIPVLGTFHEQATDEQSDAFWDLLRALDEHVEASEEPPQNGLLLGALLCETVLAEGERQPDRSPSSIAEELLGPLGNDLRLPRRDSGCLKRIIGVQHRFAQDEERRRFRIDSFVRSPYFAEALELFALRTAAEGGDPEDVERWHTLAGPQARRGADPDADEREEDGDRAPTRKKRRRRRRRRGEDEDDRFEREDVRARSDDDDEAPRDDEAHADDEAAPTIDERAADDEPAAPRKKRRRRRKPVGEFDEQDPAFPPSEAPAPHGDALQKPGRQASSRIDPSEVLFPADPGADELAEHEEASQPAPSRAKARVAPIDDEPDSDDFRDGDDRDGDDQDADLRVHDRSDDDREERDRDERDDDERRPRRRRRRRRSRGERREAAEDDDTSRERDDDDTPREREDDERDDDDTPREREDDERDDDDRAQQRDDGRERDDDDESRPPRRRRGRRGRGRGRKADGEAPRRDEAEAAPAARKGRQEKKKDPRKRRSRKGGQQPRDVDVVPRYRDRRGKVEVIEPVSLDLSAFDVELDPKRVPTFGSIVEGKGRPKHRGQRLHDKSRDEYKPPPPPGGGMDAPPPPPRSDDDPDTFGDW